MREQSRQAAAHQLRAQRGIVVLLCERVGCVGSAKTQVDVQTIPRLGDVRLRHERRPQVVRLRDLLDDVLEDDRGVRDLDW
jgi:hypothetical protein